MPGASPCEYDETEQVAEEPIAEQVLMPAEPDSAAGRWMLFTIVESATDDALGIGGNQ